ncbi:hypothetical protein, partial [Corynebacterium sp. KPL2805]
MSNMFSSTKASDYPPEKTPGVKPTHPTTHNPCSTEYKSATLAGVKPQLIPKSTNHPQLFGVMVFRGLSYKHYFVVLLFGVGGDLLSHNLPVAVP